MSIHEERDIVLDKIYSSTIRDQFVSQSLIAEELQIEYQLNVERVASVVWYLNDHRYVIRMKDNKDVIRLTPKAHKLIAEGGFVQQQINARHDLEDEIDQLEANAKQFSKRIDALEEKLRTTVQRPIIRKEGTGIAWAAVFISILALSLSIWALVKLYSGSTN